MEEEVKGLNYECNYNIYIINSMKDKNFKSQNGFDSGEESQTNVRAIYMRNEDGQELKCFIQLIEKKNNKNEKYFFALIDRQKIVLWVKKLRQCNQTFEDMLLRNEFIYFLLTCVKNGELRPPFTDVPPSEPMSKLRNLLPASNGEKSGINIDWVEDLKKADNNIPDIYRKSPDGGVFLSQQPIPKCGAFCYLAIVSKPIAGNE